MVGLNGSALDIDFLQYQPFMVMIEWPTYIKASFVMMISVLFIYFNSIMFFGICSKPTLCETSRYILFSQMLLNDSIHLVLGSLLYCFSLSNVTLTRVICSVIILLSSTTFRNAPLNLAAMSLERYVAICFPLRHADIASPRRTGITIVVVWFLGSVNFVIDIFISAITDNQYLTGYVYCTRERLFLAKWQYDMYQGFNGFFFAVVGLTIIYTYGGILVAARSIKAQKASRTVLLHLTQLGLCLTSFLFGTIERALAVFSSSLFNNLRYLNFLFILLLPRCLSPLIYGLRDESICPLFLYYLRCGPWKVKPVTAHF
ncbi:odorant receptor 131-2-like [Scleropages formosus]|uniref:odorant receptor 131-2-like n=1 Tax=Scleropages formosus TaxID=113540 RepID=UPI0010FAC875|nr:odorant receptor 131-2-like [Scleropages formosus]